VRVPQYFADEPAIDFMVGFWAVHVRRAVVHLRHFFVMK